MSTYYYVYARPGLTMSKKRNWWLAGGLLALGLGVLLWTTGPILRYQLVDAPRLGLRSYTSPIPRTEVVLNTGDKDLRFASTWFPNAAGEQVVVRNVDSFSLSIPSLKIKHADVSLVSEDLSASLVHWKGTAIPGLEGKSVIFGHSVLPQFFDPKNYMTIFSTLHRMDLGDMIFVDYDGITYQYQVVDMFEVQPTEVSVLDQDYTDSYLTLITCTPPGTYLRRLVVQSRLIPYTGDSL